MGQATDVFEAAIKLIERFGDKAVQEAEMRVRELQEEGEQNAWRFWTKVLQQVRSLTEQQSSGKRH